MIYCVTAAKVSLARRTCRQLSTFEIATQARSWSLHARALERLRSPAGDTHSFADGIVTHIVMSLSTHIYPTQAQTHALAQHRRKTANLSFVPPRFFSQYNLLKTKQVWTDTDTSNIVPFFFCVDALRMRWAVVFIVCACHRQLEGGVDCTGQVELLGLNFLLLALLWTECLKLFRSERRYSVRRLLASMLNVSCMFFFNVMSHNKHSIYKYSKTFNRKDSELWNYINVYNNVAHRSLWFLKSLVYMR